MKVFPLNSLTSARLVLLSLMGRPPLLPGSSSDCSTSSSSESAGPALTAAILIWSQGQSVTPSFAPVNGRAFPATTESSDPELPTVILTEGWSDATACLAQTAHLKHVQSTLQCFW